MRDVNSKLFAVRLSESRTRIEALLEKAEHIGALGRIDNPNLLRQRLNSVVRLHRAVCKLEEIKAAQMPGAGEESTVSDVARFVERLSPGARFVALVAFAGFLVGFVVLGNLLYTRIYALISNRRVCRIEAAIEQGLDVVDGTVTILGSRGCRFQPVNKGAYARAGQLIWNDGLFLVLNGKRYGIESGLLQEHSLVMFFRHALSRAEQAEVLKLSSITPREVPDMVDLRKGVRRRIARKRRRRH